MIGQPWQLELPEGTFFPEDIETNQTFKYSVNLGKAIMFINYLEDDGLLVADTENELLLEGVYQIEVKLIDQSGEVTDRLYINITVKEPDSYSSIQGLKEGNLTTKVETYSYQGDS